jgi:hypothetical protein
MREKWFSSVFDVSFKIALTIDFNKKRQQQQHFLYVREKSFEIARQVRNGYAGAEKGSSLDLRNVRNEKETNKKLKSSDTKKTNFAMALNLTGRFSATEVLISIGMDVSWLLNLFT